MIGIYKIWCYESKKTYIGSSLNIERRFREHQSDLRLGTHPNPKLQALYNKRKTLCYNVIVECKKSELERFEQMFLDVYLDLLGAEKVLNIRLDDVSTNRGIKRSDETRKKMSEAKKGNQYNLGRKHTKETRQKISESLIGNQRNLGYKHSEKTRRKVSESLKGHQRIAKTWIVTHPNGDLETVFNLRKFCRENNLHDGHMVAVSKGERSHHKHFKCVKIG